MYIKDIIANNTKVLYNMSSKISELKTLEVDYTEDYAGKPFEDDRGYSIVVLSLEDDMEKLLKMNSELQKAYEDGEYEDNKTGY